MPVVEEYVDAVVVGAGHAGCEAALACARLGLETAIFTVSVDSIALMPCNPNIGGSSKGHLVRELDALGGEMGKVIDKTFIQSKMLNVSKGPAVHSLRAQADKAQYSRTMRQVLENTDHLQIVQAEVCEILVENEHVTGVKLYSGAIYHAKAVILCTGTYLKARCIYGDVSTYTGPNGLQAANHLTDSLKNLGIEMFRFKTGTPARIDKRSIDFSKMEEQTGDKRVVPFSFTTDPESVQIDQVSCWLTYTNEKTHEIIRNNLERSPLYSGNIKGTGPRYCPSIEDKVVRFADKNRHQVFIEPEGLFTNEMYVGGMSSSLPEDVQHDMYHSVPGLEHAKIVKNAYAIEYDCINPRQLYPTLEFKAIKGLFSGGQFNDETGKITLVDMLRCELESAPRIIKFSPDGRFAYLICELKNYISVYSYKDGPRGPVFELVQTISTLNEYHSKGSAACVLRFSRDWNYVLCSNAGDNSVGIFKIDRETGKLEKICILPISGDYPKAADFFPDNRHIMALNHESNTMTIFRINYEKKYFSLWGKPLKVETPNCILVSEIEEAPKQ